MESIIRGKQTNRRKKIKIHVRADSSVSFERATRQQVRAHRRVAARHVTPGGGVLKQTESNVTAFHHGTPRRSRPGL